MTEAITAPGLSDNEGRRRWRRPGATRADHGTSLAWRADELLQALGELVGRTVGDRFAEAPLFLPTESFAGEPFRPTLGWYKRVASRLMGHAGLGAYQLAIGLKADPKRPEANGPVAIPDPSGSHVLAWFAGLDRDAVPPVCHFGFDARQAAEPEVLVAALAHEVAHAFRAHHGLDPHLHGEVEDARARRLEEELTDITTHALGFGVLTTNASYRYRPAHPASVAPTRRLCRRPRRGARPLLLGPEEPVRLRHPPHHRDGAVRRPRRSPSPCRRPPTMRCARLLDAPPRGRGRLSRLRRSHPRRHRHLASSLTRTRVVRPRLRATSRTPGLMTRARLLIFR